ncbi:hypothetical protein J3R30DRAFT_3500438 [Lentinula aciculospora]|uniref:C2H2-type domain-containing protein n=1 Tax=Lentinula aciculospora TaxID=153920 RepID=A0A9W9A6E2_9AGAR|nr:hypothetical protein J3R30DRAFT_3500438 [Lentinula aciculospora]
MKRSPSSPSSPVHKSSRKATTKSTSGSSLLCTLPPTCNTHSTVLADTQELEAHYAKYHAWVCQATKPTGGMCGNVFPDARLLELHHTECHDPIAAVRKERGEKIFACFVLPSLCTNVFLTPKARRLHLIAIHGYPKEYFFAVANKGVGGLLARWGDGAGMIRGKWKPRSKEEEQDEEKEKEGHEHDQENSEGTTDEEESDESSDPEPTTRGNSSNNNHQPSSMAMDIDALTTSFQTSLSVSSVPSSIRFGRGAKRGSRGGRGTNSRRYQFPNRDQEASTETVPRRGRGGIRGGRGIRGGIRGGFDRN